MDTRNGSAQNHASESHQLSQQHQPQKSLDTDPQAPTSITSEAFKPPPDSSDSRPFLDALHKAGDSSLPDFTEIVRAGVLSKLILCLSSTDHDVLSQALSNINTLCTKLSHPRAETQCPSSKQLWLLLGILTDSVQTVHGNRSGNPHSSLTSLPYTVTTFAALAAPILTEATHPLYEQINTFLLRAPVFEETKILGHWLHHTLRAPPTDFRNPPRPQGISEPNVQADDLELSSWVTQRPLPLTCLAELPYPKDPYHTSVHFMLSYLYHAIRTSEDLDLARASNALEAVLAVAGSDVFLPRGLRELAIAILWRITSIEGGSTTLITRAGVVPWLCGLVYTRGVGKSAVDLVGSSGLRQLAKRIWETCDQPSMSAWDGGNLRESAGEGTEQATRDGARYGVERMAQDAVEYRRIDSGKQPVGQAVIDEK
ncbi:MAG: hypothetical protein Q9162_006430 [Coniocarpon cinnabarinum]